ncbi:MAG: hypothetical protein KGM43_00490, partial [Planctomycetota bacterium]|nr:hypothetical protein [Planctomycetota bacterium]
MGSLRTLTILLALGAWGAATEGAPPGDATPPSSGSGTRPAPTVPPRKYLEAGAKLSNSGQYDLAVKYLKAANTYRDQLTVADQTVLDAYLNNLKDATLSDPNALADAIAAA